MLATQLFHQRTSLFKLTQRSSMEPNIPSLRVDMLAQVADSIALATPHLAHLLAEKACDDDAQLVEIDD